MRTWLCIICAASLLMISFAVGAADYGSSSPITGTNAPVAQTLVREGDFAIKLAAELNLESPTNESAAEDLLVEAGVAPLNGWLSDYPMTPQIIGQLQESISRAASQGRVPMTSDQAVRGLYALTAQFDLPTPAGQDPATSQSEPSPPVYPSDQQVINNYYDTGPPIVTYYPPPMDYLYLYDWVPYPVWWFGFWFPGFYICQNFSTVVVFQYRTVVVSNHFVDHDTRTVVTVDPHGQPGRHGGRPETVLRTEQGDRYRTFADMRRGVRVAGPPEERRHRPDERSFAGAGRQWTPDARRSAGAIYSRSMRVPLLERGNVRSANGDGSREVLRRSSGPLEGQRAGGERNWSVPSQQRYSQFPAMRENDQGGGRHFAGSDRPFSNELLTSPALPRDSFRSFSGTSSGQGHGTRPGPSPGESWQGRDMGSAFSGGGCRGRC